MTLCPRAFSSPGPHRRVAKNESFHRRHVLPAFMLLYIATQPRCVQASRQGASVQVCWSPEAPDISRIFGLCRSRERALQVRVPTATRPSRQAGTSPPVDRQPMRPPAAYAERPDSPSAPSTTSSGSPFGTSAGTPVPSSRLHGALGSAALSERVPVRRRRSSAAVRPSEASS